MIKKIVGVIAFAFIVTSLLVGAIFTRKPGKVTIPNNPASQICQKIIPLSSDEDNFCLALVNSDEKYCQAIESQGKYICLAELKKDSTFCQKLPPDSSRHCYQNLVLAIGKPNSCEELGSTDDIAACYVHFISSNYFASNLTVLKADYCQKIPKSMPERSLCEAMVNQDEKYCLKDQVDCLAHITKNIRLCNQTASQTDKNECYHSIAMTTKNSSLCNKIQEQGPKDDCWLDFSRISNDETICLNIKNQEQKAQCFKNIAKNLVDKSFIP